MPQALGKVERHKQYAGRPSVRPKRNYKPSRSFKARNQTVESAIACCTQYAFIFLYCRYAGYISSRVSFSCAAAVPIPPQYENPKPWMLHSHSDVKPNDRHLSPLSCYVIPFSAIVNRTRTSHLLVSCISYYFSCACSNLWIWSLWLELYTDYTVRIYFRSTAILPKLESTAPQIPYCNIRF
jgi:hypothetical protein